MSGFGSTYLGKLLFTFLISMVPVVELRGGLPFGVGMGLPYWQAYLVSVAGNMVPVPFIILFLRKVFEWMSRHEKTKKLVDKLERIGQQKGEKVRRYEGLGLFILVAIPLPGTGAWTGALVASVLDMRMRTALPVILLGVMAAGVIMLLLSHGVVSLL